MCNRYTAPEAEAIERYWRITGRNLPRWGKRLVFPHAPGPSILRWACQDGGDTQELAVGRLNTESVRDGNLAAWRILDKSHILSRIH